MQHQTPPSSSTSSLAIQLSEPNTHSPSSLNNKTVTHQQDITLNLNDINARNYLWDLLRTHSTVDELVDQFGSILHNKITFWDLAQLKLKYSRPNNHLKTTYQIIDDYTVLYSNMRTYLERFVNDQASTSGSAALSASNNSNIGSSSSRKVISSSLFFSSFFFAYLKIIRLISSRTIRVEVDPRREILENSRRAASQVVVMAIQLIDS